MSEASYTAWDDNLYEWPPPAGWYQASDGKWWPEGYGPPAAEASAAGTSDVSSHGHDEHRAEQHSAEGDQEAGFDPSQTAFFPAGSPLPGEPIGSSGELRFASSREERAEAESQRPVYDELPPIDDVFGGIDPFADDEGREPDAAPGAPTSASTEPQPEPAAPTPQPEPQPGPQPDPRRDQARDQPRDYGPPPEGNAAHRPTSGPLAEPGAEAAERPGWDEPAAWRPAAASETMAAPGGYYDDGHDNPQDNRQAPSQHNRLPRSGPLLEESPAPDPHAYDQRGPAQQHPAQPGPVPGGQYGVTAPVAGMGAQDTAVASAAPAGYAEHAHSGHAQSGPIMAPQYQPEDGYPAGHEQIDDREGSKGRGLWLLLGGLVLTAVVGFGAWFVLVRVDGSGGDDSEAFDVAAAQAATGLGSLNDPYEFGTGVVVFYDAPAGELRWTVEVVGPVADETSQLVSNQGAAQPPADQVLAVTRLEITYQSGPAPGPVGDLQLSSIGPSLTLFDQSNSDACPVSDQLDLTANLQPGESVEGNLCWQIPSSDLAQLKLAVEAEPTDGTVFMELS